MTTLLLKDADVLVTMDAARREIPGGGVFIRDGVIEAVGPSDQLPSEADQVISLAGTVALPGLVNTHHHMYQSLTRAIPGAQDAELFGWLRRLYPIWAGHRRPCRRQSQAGPADGRGNAEDDGRARPAAGLQDAVLIRR